MLPLILIPLLLCVFNIYRRLTCFIKVKFTKYTFISLVFALALLLFAGYRLKNDLVGYLIALSWWLAFFTSMMSAGISERGIIHPWQLVAKLYRWDRIRSFSIENKGKTIMVNFKIFRDLRQEYDKSDLDKIKKIAKKNKLI
ncbi:MULTISPECIES: hypothetical protein [unclassified Parvimonas]|uniref:hypothetical protein n=1 Tax=unclassified Parvimonas TaxID=1151464 RepID=UPI0039E4011B